MSRGIETRKQILQTAFELSSMFGLEGLSIGELAKKVGMSKSGLFGHFKSKEKLQILVLDYASEIFTRRIILPALSEPRGLPRIKKMMINWQDWSNTYLPGGCPFISAVVEYDDRPGPVREHLREIQLTMLGTLEKAFQITAQEGQIHHNADCKQLAYELYGNMLSFHIYNRLLQDPNAHERFEQGLDAIIAKVKSARDPSVTPAQPTSSALL